MDGRAVEPKFRHFQPLPQHEALQRAAPRGIDRGSTLSHLHTAIKMGGGFAGQAAGKDDVPTRLVVDQRGERVVGDRAECPDQVGQQRAHTAGGVGRVGGFAFDPAGTVKESVEIHGRRSGG